EQNRPEMPPNRGQPAAARVAEPRAEGAVGGVGDVLEVVRLEQREIARMRRLPQPLDRRREDALHPLPIEVLLRRELPPLLARNLPLRRVDLERRPPPIPRVLGRDEVLEQTPRIRP